MKKHASEKRNDSRVKLHQNRYEKVCFPGPVRSNLSITREEQEQTKTADAILCCFADECIREWRPCPCVPALQ